MTRVVPSRLQRVCASAESKSVGVTVSCPRVLPAGFSDASVLAPRRSVVRPGAEGDDGRRRFRGSRAFYVIDAYSSSLPKRHWSIGGGAAADLEAWGLASDEQPTTSLRRAGGRTLEVRRYPSYPRGGVNGGHVVAVARDRASLRFVSVHGWEHEDVAVSMLLDALRR